MLWEVDPDPCTTSQRESTDSAPYLEKAAPPEGVTGSPEMAIRPAPEATRSIQAVECSTTQPAPSDMAQDTKPAAQPRVTSTLYLRHHRGHGERHYYSETPASREATLSTQTYVVSEPSKQEIMEATTETTPSPVSGMVNQMMNRSLVPATCCCGRVTLPRETPAPSDPSSDQQQVTEPAEKSL